MTHCTFSFSAKDNYAELKLQLGWGGGGDPLQDDLTPMAIHRTMDNGLMRMKITYMVGYRLHGHHNTIQLKARLMSLFE